MLGRIRRGSARRNDARSIFGNENVLPLQIVVGVNVRGGRRMLLLARAFLPRDLAESCAKLAAAQPKISDTSTPLCTAQHE